jgi:hypothetical protein
MIGIDDGEFRKNPEAAIAEAVNFDLRKHADRFLEIVVKRPPIYRPIKRYKYNRHIAFMKSQRPDVLYSYIHSMLSFFLLRSLRRAIEEELSAIGIPSSMGLSESRARRAVILGFLYQDSTPPISMN